MLRHSPQFSVYRIALTLFFYDAEPIVSFSDFLFAFRIIKAVI